MIEGPVVKKSYTVGEQGTITLEIDRIEEPYTAEDLFVMGLRYKNPKRSFLFVSRVLGKHIPIAPHKLEEASTDLATAWTKEVCDNSDRVVAQPTLVIGFAETATAMGQAFFNALEGDCTYLHSTREMPGNIDSLFYACESHSHAVDHNFFLADTESMAHFSHIVIVDDEITTGKTALNLIKAIDGQFPGKKYSVASFLDWRNSEDRERYMEGINGTEIKTVSLLSGHIKENSLVGPTTETDTNWLRPEAKTPKWTSSTLNFPLSPYESTSRKFIIESGRFGLTSMQQETLLHRIKEAEETLREKRTGQKVLVLGHGESMYIAMKLAAVLGDHVSFHATTRSPAWPTKGITPYGMASGFQVDALNGEAYTEYLYNMEDAGYDELFFISEYSLPTEKIAPFMAHMSALGINSLHHIVLGA